jgi:multiple sugar transport system ATP-binding protein
MATVKYDQATRIYPGTAQPAVSGLDLAVGDGEFLVLVGPSGSGKSTALRMLAGLEDVDAGAIYIQDRDVTNLPPKSRDIAMVFQNYALYPHMTVYENMAFALRLRKMQKREIDQRVKKAAGLLQLDEYLDRKPKALSGGQRQRVAMGRAIVREPHVFLMDEPLSNLDAKLRVQTRSQIATLQAGLGITTVYVTHDQVEAMTMGHRVAVLDRGILQQVDTPPGAVRPADQRVRGRVYRLPGDEHQTGPADRLWRRVRRHGPAADPRAGRRGPHRRHRPRAGRFPARERRPGRRRRRGHADPR